MRMLFFTIVLWGSVFQGFSVAGSPTSELDDDLAKKLISQVLDIAPNGIHVASVIEGGKRSEDGFEERQMRRVTVVQPVLEEGRMIRRVRCYDFSWNSKYGWFYKESRQTRAGEEIRIWSEIGGEQVVK